LFKSLNPKIEKNIFKCAEFWLSKGYLVQSAAASHKNKPESAKSGGAVDANNVALDYYLSGVKIDNRHFGCIYNAACSYYFEKKFVNANKWFSYAVRVDPTSEDAKFGNAVTCLKLGFYQEALRLIKILDGKGENKTS
jgi:tetratricopeptide (TPR) repeat protein